MKKIRLYISLTLVAFFCVFATVSNAQDQDSGYRVIKFNKGEKLLTLVSGDELTLKLDEPYSGDNAISQYFIVRRLDNNNVFIVSASQNDLLLQRNDDGLVVLAPFSEDAKADFEWRIDYAGFPYCVFSTPDASNSVISIGDDGILKMANIEALKSNDAEENFRFGLEKSDIAIF